MKELRALSFDDVLKEVQERQEKLERKLAAMTPEERAEWDKQEAIRAQEEEELVRQLRGPGFVEFEF